MGQSAKHCLIQHVHLLQLLGAVAVQDNTHAFVVGSTHGIGSIRGGIAFCIGTSLPLTLTTKDEKRRSSAYCIARVDWVATMVARME